MPAYRFTNRARHDFEEVAEFAIFRFGLKKSMEFRDRWDSLFTALASNPDMGQPIPAGGEEPVYRYDIRTHAIFYTPYRDGISIVRIMPQ